MKSVNKKPAGRPGFAISAGFCYQNSSFYPVCTGDLRPIVAVKTDPPRASVGREQDHAPRIRLHVSPHRSQIILRKEVIQPQVPLRLPCYDLVPIIELTFGTSPLAVSIATSGPPNFRGLTGGVYKAQEHIHRGMLTRDY